MSTLPFCRLAVLILSLACFNGSAQQPDPTKPASPDIEELFIEQFRVPAGFFKPVNQVKDAASKGTEKSGDPIICTGVTFKGAYFAMYNPYSQTLVIKGTRKEIEGVRKAIADFTAQSAKKKPTRK